jgi:hypothetical protein
LIPSILGGGEVIAHALVAGTPRIGVSGVTAVVAGAAVVSSGVVVGVDPGIDVGVGEDVFTSTGREDGVAQPLSKNTTITSANNDFITLIRVSSSP